jgi:hypothetical protein
MIEAVDSKLYGFGPLTAEALVKQFPFVAALL